jgi:hypothetical protein
MSWLALHHGMGRTFLGVDPFKKIQKYKFEHVGVVLLRELLHTSQLINLAELPLSIPFPQNLESFEKVGYPLVGGDWLDE